MGAEVPVLAPVAAESAVHTRQAPGGGKEELRRRSSPWEVYTVRDRPRQKSRLRVLHGKIISLEGCFDTTTQITNRFGKTRTQMTIFKQPHNLFSNKIQAGIYRISLHWRKIKHNLAQTPDLIFSSQKVENKANLEELDQLFYKQEYFKSTVTLLLGLGVQRVQQALLVRVGRNGAFVKWF